MKVIFTKHALLRMTERKIHSEWVLETINSPDIIKPMGFLWEAIRKINGFTLGVVFQKTKPLRIITVYKI